MTTRPSVDQLIRAYLEDGPTILPDRVLDDLRGDINRLDQRAARGLRWRTTSMSRTILAAAAALVVAAVSVAFWASRQMPQIGGPSPTPASSVVAPTGAPSQASSAPTGLRGTLEPGGTYPASLFGEPFHFVLPSSLSAAGTSAREDPHTVRLDYGDLSSVTFLDDPTNLAPNLCDAPLEVPQAPFQIPDLSAVDGWLGSSYFVTKSAPIELRVDGRTALRWEVSCSQTVPPTTAQIVWLKNTSAEALYAHVLYAIPSGDDTILAITFRNDPGDALGYDSWNSAMDQLVSSMTFD